MYTQLCYIQYHSFHLEYLYLAAPATDFRAAIHGNHFKAIIIYNIDLLCTKQNSYMHVEQLKK